MSKLGPISHFLSLVSCDSLVLQGLRCVKCGVIALTLSYWSLEVQLGTKIIFSLHKDGVGYKKIAKTLKLSWSTVVKTIQRFNRTGSTQNRSHHGWAKKLSTRAQCHIQRMCLGNRRTYECQHCLQRLKGWRVSLSVLRPYTAHCIKLVWMAVIPEGSLF